VTEEYQLGHGIERIPTTLCFASQRIERKLNNMALNFDIVAYVGKAATGQFESAGLGS
jgi:hypothetical protein